MLARFLHSNCLSGLVLLGTAAVTSASAHSIILGVGTHFINYPAAQPALLDLAREVGANSVRADTGWKFVEITKRVYKIPPAWDQFVDNAKRRGIEPLLILDYGNKLYDGGKLPRSRDAIDGFVRFATFVVKHFAGRVRYYEIWNEWNTGTGGYYPGGSAVAYAQLFDATYAAIKRIDPNTVVLASAGYGNWYEQIASIGVAARADGVAIHPYVPKESAYEASPGSDGAERSARRVIGAEATMRRLSGKAIPLYITEIGWSTSTGKRGYPEQAVAAMAERSLLMFAALPYVRGVWWYDLINDGPDAASASDRFGLFRRQLYAIKPAGKVVQSIAPLLRENDLTWNPASYLIGGLVVLNRSRTTPPSIIAWDDYSSMENAGVTYAVSCNASLKIVRSLHKIPLPNLPIDSVPSIFTYHAGQCTSKPLIGQ